MCAHGVTAAGGPFGTTRQDRGEEVCRECFRILQSAVIPIRGQVVIDLGRLDLDLQICCRDVVVTGGGASGMGFVPCEVMRHIFAGGLPTY